MTAAEEFWEAHISTVTTPRRANPSQAVRVHGGLQPSPQSVTTTPPAALELPRRTAEFHLDRLADEDLLDVTTRAAQADTAHPRLEVLVNRRWVQ
jgi:hypothetical protein